MENEVETGVIKGLYRNPSIQILPTLGPKVCNYYLLPYCWHSKILHDLSILYQYHNSQCIMYLGSCRMFSIHLLISILIPTHTVNETGISPAKSLVGASLVAVFVGLEGVGAEL